MSEIGDNWQRVGERVAAAVQRIGRDRDSVRVLAVAKTKSAAMIDAAIAAGARDIGENYIQEAMVKMPQVSRTATWHFIGHLQRNKARKAVELFEIVHTVDSIALAQTLQRQAAEEGRILRILIEVNVAGEASKQGVAASAVESLLDDIGGCTALRVEGLMTIPPAGPSAQVRPYFRMLRQLRDRLQLAAPANAPLGELSMGMTDDFECAIEEGATMVRIGRAIFGRR